MTEGHKRAEIKERLGSRHSPKDAPAIWEALHDLGAEKAMEIARDAWLRLAHQAVPLKQDGQPRPAHALAERIMRTGDVPFARWLYETWVYLANQKRLNDALWARPDPKDARP